MSGLVEAIKTDSITQITVGVVGLAAFLSILFVIPKFMPKLGGGVDWKSVIFKVIGSLGTLTVLGGGGYLAYTAKAEGLDYRWYRVGTISTLCLSLIMTILALYNTYKGGSNRLTIFYSVMVALAMVVTGALVMLFEPTENQDDAKDPEDSATTLPEENLTDAPPSPEITSPTTTPEPDDPSYLEEKFTQENKISNLDKESIQDTVDKLNR